MRKASVFGLLAAIILIISLAIAKRHELVRLAVEAGAGLAGYPTQIAELHIGWRGSELVGVEVASRGAGTPLLIARRVVLRYALRDLLPGSRHRYGLRGLEIDGAKLTLIRFPNGNFDVNIPGAAAPAAPVRVNGVPLAFALRVRDCAIELQEPSAYDVSAKDVRIDGISGDASVDTASVTRYAVRGAFEERRREPFRIAGRVDAIAGYAMHRAQAAYFPVRALANYFADTPALRILGGEGRNLDARLYALGVHPNETPAYHVSLRLDVVAGRLALQSLAAPVENLNARLEVIDNAFFVRDARAALAGIALHIDGGGYDFTGALTGRAQLRLGVRGTGDLSALRAAFTFARDQPISGPAELGVLVHGPIDDPVIIARVHAAHAWYRALPFSALSAGVVYHSNVVALAPVRVSYSGIAVRVNGTMDLGRRLRSHFVVHVTGPASNLPYLDEMLGDEPIVVDASATGEDLRFRVVGSAASARGVSRLAALVVADPNGTMTVAPFWFHTERGDFDAGYVLDRPDATSAFWMLASGLRMRASSFQAFPGISLPQMPPVDARAVEMRLAGGGAGNDILIAGRLDGSDARIAGVSFNSVDAAFGGSLQNAALNKVRARGPWGTFDGKGSFSAARFVAYGAYRGTFEGLQPFLGSALAGHGPIAGTVGIAVEPQRIVVQGSDLAMSGATLRGVPIDRASLTLAIAGNRLRIYSADAAAAGGEVVAAGTFTLAPPGVKTESNGVGLVAKRLKAAQLRGIGLPMEAGTISAVGNLAAGSPIPTFDGSVAIDNGRIAHFGLTGNGNVRVAGDAVSLRRVLGALGGTYATIDGSINSLSSGSPALALNANVAAAQIAPALHSFDLPNYMTNGTFNARLHISGPTLAPSVAGSVGVPGGDLNGLPFIDASALLSADPHGVAIRRGAVLVGSTATYFTAVSRPREQLIDLRAPRARLEDFDNFFDTGDTLDGTGRVKLAAASHNAEITSSGDIDIRGFRYRNFTVGDTKAVWSSARNVIRGSLAVGGKAGMLGARGSIALNPTGAWQSTLMRSGFNLSGNVDRLDLSFWLPALGMQGLPITGRASGDATIRGRYPNIDLRSDARVVGGTLGPLELDRADLTLHSAGSRVVIERAEMATSAMSASATGTLGLGANAPLDVAVHASTDHLAQLVYDVSRVRVPIRGSFESTLNVRGTYKSPTLAAGFDGNDIIAYGIPIASLFGEVRVERRALVLSNVGATFTHGEATLAGSLPLQLAPLRLAAPDQPISFDLDVLGLDPAIFNQILGADTKLGGTIDGHLGLSGTVRQPIIVGRVSLINGSYVSGLELTPLSQIAAALVFDRTNWSLQHFSARVGTGTIGGSGSAQFPNGFSAVGSTLSLRAFARGAQLDLPAYGSGTLDGSIALSKHPGGNALLSGDATLSNAALAFAGFVKAAQQSSASAGPPLPLAFDLKATAGRNVRVKGSGYGAGLDIGVAGSVNLGGTLAAPTLAGTFDSTGGTLTYFDRAFRVQQGNVRFNPADGVLPTLHAVATASVVNPDPDRARNPYGSAQITIRVDGPIAGLRIALTSTPPGYTQGEILGLIAPFGGFVGGIGFSRQGMLAPQEPGGITPFGAVSPIPNVALAQRSSITVGQEAFNLLNAQFTAGLLSPLETTLGQGLGLSSVNLTLGYYGNVGLTASRLLGKYVNAVYAVTFGIPQTQSFGLTVTPNPETTAALNFFVQTGPTKLFQVPVGPTGFGAGYLATEPLIGNTGFSLTYQRHFW